MTASTIQPGTTSRIGQIATMAAAGRNQATTRAVPRPMPVSAARTARGVMGSGSYDAHLDWPPMLASLLRLPAAALLLGAGIGIVAALAAAVATGTSEGFDGAVIHAVRAPALDTILSPLRWITQLGSTWAIFAVAALAFGFAAAIGPWRHGLAGALTILAASIGNSFLKITMARERPDLLEPIIVEHGFSFPSGHSALSMVAYGVLAVLVGRSRLPRPVRTAAIVGLGILVGLIGISRVWLGVHYPTDVIAGWVAGGVVVLAFAALSRRASPAPAAGAVDADPAVPRSDRPAPG